MVSERKMVSLYGDCPGVQVYMVSRCRELAGLLRYGVQDANRCSPYRKVKCNDSPWIMMVKTLIHHGNKKVQKQRYRADSCHQ